MPALFIVSSRSVINNTTIIKADLGIPPNYTEVDENGFLQAHGAARAYLDYNFAATALGTGASAPDLANIGAGTIFYRVFDGGVTSEQLFGTVEMNHNWAERTIVYPHVHWFATTNDAGNVVWRLTWSVSQNGVRSPELTVTGIGAANGTGIPVFTNLTAIDLFAYTIGAQFNFRFWRWPNNPDGLDTYEHDAGAETLGIHVLTDTLGSRNVDSK